jgi:hypothetical protein
MRPTSEGCWTNLFRTSDKVGDLDFLLRAKRDVAAAKASSDFRRTSRRKSTEIRSPTYVNDSISRITDQSSCSSVRCSASNIFGESQPQLPASNSGVGSGRVSSNSKVLTPKANCSRYLKRSSRSIVYVKLRAPTWLSFQHSRQCCRMYVEMVAVAPVLDCRRWGSAAPGARTNRRLRWFNTYTRLEIWQRPAPRRTGTSWLRSCRGYRLCRRWGMRAHRCGAGRRQDAVASVPAHDRHCVRR